MFLTSFIKKKTVPVKSITEKNHDFWMNGLQYLWLKDRQECLTIRGRDIECCWVDNHGNKQWVDEWADDEFSRTSCNKDYTANCDFMIRTRSGKEFSIKYEDWLKARFEDPNYKCVK